MSRIIGHLDMDAFFAAIEERDNPRLAGRPIVVGADPKDGAGRGVVSTANYAARAYGIRSALPISKAWQFSEAARKRGLPPAVFIDVRMKKYGEVSRRIMAILEKYAKEIEQASVDEAYFDLSSVGSFEASRSIAVKIKNEIKEQEHLTASIGIGPNKLIAKIASDAEKPDGLTVVTAADAEAFLESLSIRVIPGIGPKAEEKFRALGMKTIGDAKKLLPEQLKKMMGKWGTDLYEKLRGRSDSPLVTEWEAKSISEQETFETDTLDPNFLIERLQELSRGVFAHFSKSGFKSFRTITLTVRFGDFTTMNRSLTLKSPSAKLETVNFEILKLFLPFLDSRENRTDHRPNHHAEAAVGPRTLGSFASPGVSVHMSPQFVAR